MSHPRPPTPSDVVAQRVREVRKRRGWAAVHLAERCAEIGAPELTAQTIANIENGRKDKTTGQRRRHITVDEVVSLAKALNVPPARLWPTLLDRCPVCGDKPPAGLSCDSCGRSTAIPVDHRGEVNR